MAMDFFLKRCYTDDFWANVTITIASDAIIDDVFGCYGFSIWVGSHDFFLKFFVGFSWFSWFLFGFHGFSRYFLGF